MPSACVCVIHWLSEHACQDAFFATERHHFTMGMLRDLCQPPCNASLTFGQVSYPLRLRLCVMSSVHMQGSATALEPALVAAHQVLWQVWNLVGMS